MKDRMRKPGEVVLSEVCKALGVSPTTGLALVKETREERPRLAATKRGGVWYVPSKELRRFLVAWPSYARPKADA